MSRRSSLTHTACRCMVVLSGTSLADSLLPWRLPSIKFSGEFNWRLPRNCHTRILHHLDSVFNQLVHLSDRFSRKTCESNSYLLRESFTLLNINVFTPVSSNRYCAHKYVKLYFEEDHTCICADFARHLRISSSSLRDLDIESMIQIICCN